MPEAPPPSEPSPGLAPGGAEALANLPLARLPTPIDEAPRLARELGLARLLIKREDQSGYGLGGNKLRQLDAILADALSRGCDAIVTTASVQSNYCRSMAAACARLGLDCTLLLRGTAEAPLQGNLLLDRVFGARVRFIEASDPWDPRALAALQAASAELAASGRRPAIVQLTGETAPLAASAWVEGARELDRQLTRAGADPDTLYVAVGSGLTLCGLALGFALLGRRCRVVGISVQQSASRLAPWVRQTLEALARRLGAPEAAARARYEIDDAFVGPGYGVPSAASIAAVLAAGRSEGLVLDPIYSGKAMAGLIAHARAGRTGPAGAVFLHSGGTPGLFAHADAFADAAAAAGG